MSQNGQGSSKLPTATIKLATTDGSVNDVGPGDPSAAPSVAPELVDVPDPPTASQLVVKSTSPSRAQSSVRPGEEPPSKLSLSKALGSGPKPVPTESKPVPTESKPVPTESKPIPTESKPIPIESKPAQTDDDKKLTKFRYHRRVSVHTTGKVNPDGILKKVSPSNLDDLDPEELLKKSGIKTNNQTHWRMRLRQTKRVTKGGKTTTQTKIAYRDSEGNVKKEGGSTGQGSSHSGRVCKKCEKKIEDCKCDGGSS